MSYTAAALIINAYYLSGVVSRELQSVTGTQMNDGLELLNELLAIKTANQKLIPYYTNVAITCVPNQEMYFIPNLITAETLTFNIGPVRYSMQSNSRKQYFGTSRVDNIGSLPFNWHVERCFGGANLYLYFVPNSNYPVSLWGKFSLQQVTIDQDLSLTLDPFYLTYLRYGLAKYICDDNNNTFSPSAEQKLKEMEQMLINVSPPDLNMTKLSTLQNGAVLNWGFINLSGGWVP